MISFRVDITPVPKGRPRMTRGGQPYTPAATRHFEQAFRRRCQPFAPSTPLEGPLAVRFVFSFEPPKSWPKWQLAMVEEWPHVSVPDADNLFKACADSMTDAGTWWRDDAQMVRIVASKRYAAVSSIEVEVEELPMPTREGRPRAAVASPAARRATSIVVDHRRSFDCFDDEQPRCPQEMSTQPGHPVRQCELVAGHHGRCRWAP